MTTSSIDTTAILDRVTSRAHGWTQSAGAPEPIQQAAAAHREALSALDDALVEYEIEVATRRTALRKHNEAVAEALRDGKKLPAAKVPSAEEIDVRHGAIISARERFVHEAASAADRVAHQHYAQWRADVVEQLQAATSAVAQVASASANAIDDWGSAASVLARLDRHWAPRTSKLDGASAVHQMEIWGRISNIESTQLARNVLAHGDRLRELTGEPIIAEYVPAAAPEQYSAAYLAEQSPGVRQALTGYSAGS